MFGNNIHILVYAYVYRVKISFSKFHKFHEEHYTNFIKIVLNKDKKGT